MLYGEETEGVCKRRGSLMRPEQTGIIVLPLDTAMGLYRSNNRVFLVEEHLLGRHLKAVNGDFQRYLPDTCCSYCAADD